MRNILNNKGFTLIEVLISALLLGFVVLGLISLSNVIQSSKNQLDTILAIVNYRAVIIANLKGSDSFAMSAAGNTCILNRTGCGAATTAPTPLAVLDKTGATITSTAANDGFDKAQQLCHTFPSVACPFQFQMNWWMVCNGASACSVPELKVSGVLNVSPGLSVSLNSNKYTISMVLGQFIGSLEQSCSSLGGTYVAGEPPSCNMPLNQTCPNTPTGGAMRVVGINAGPPVTLNCQPVDLVIPSCAPTSLGPPIVVGQIMTGIDLNGVPQCKNITPTFVTAICVNPTDPGCRPHNCEQNPGDPTCPVAGPAAGFTPIGRDGGCDGGGGC